MHDDHSPSLKFLGKDRQNWWCFVCNKGGHGPIRLVMEHQGVDFIDACRILGDMYGILIDGTVCKCRIRTIAKRTSAYSDANEMSQHLFNKNICEWVVTNSGLSVLAKDFLFTKRHLSSHIVESLNIGSISNPSALRNRLCKAFDIEDLKRSGLIKEETGNLCLFTPCLVFPYYDTLGDLIGLQTRYLGGRGNAPRFQFISKQKSRLFNLPIIQRMNKGDELYIAEGVTDCMALLSSGLNAVALPSATIIPDDDLYQLKDFKLKMYPDMDNNQTGLNCYYALESFFIRLGTKIEKLTLPNGIKDYGEYYASIYADKNGTN